MHKPHKQKLTELQGKVDKTAIIDFNAFFSNKQTKTSLTESINSAKDE